MVEDVFFGIGEKFLHEVLEMVCFTHEICMVGSKAVYKVGSFSACFIAVDGTEIFGKAVEATVQYIVAQPAFNDRLFPCKVKTVFFFYECSKLVKV